MIVTVRIAIEFLIDGQRQTTVRQMWPDVGTRLMVLVDRARLMLVDRQRRRDVIPLAACRATRMRVPPTTPSGTEPRTRAATEIKRVTIVATTTMTFALNPAQRRLVQQAHARRPRQERLSVTVDRARLLLTRAQAPPRLLTTSFTQFSTERTRIAW